jgi:predicted TIM-barrel fold metal-dependent hydrolase
VSVLGGDEAAVAVGDVAGERECEGVPVEVVGVADDELADRREVALDGVQVAGEHPDTFVGFGSVDPRKGERAVAELDEVAELGLRGLKLHPSMQAFDPDDERHWPIFERCCDLGLVCLVHTGTSGAGAAAFPELLIVAAHFGWPWHSELIAMAHHKSNIFIDISGWAPRYIPVEVVREFSGRLQDRFLFGSDSPFLPPERCLQEIDALGLEAGVREKLLRENARRLLGL